MCPDNVASQSVERELLQALRFGGIDKENLNELVKIVAGFHREGIQKVKVFPIGIPVIDGLEVRTILDLTGVMNVLKGALQTPRTTGIAVFPYGIPNPDVFQVNVRLGGVQER